MTKIKVWIIGSSKWRTTHLTIYDKGMVFGSNSACKLVEADNEETRVLMSSGAIPTCSICLRLFKGLRPVLI